MKVKYSIVVPLYNKSSYIKDTLESICHQLTIDTEVIIIDDGSTDDSVSIVEEFIHKYQQIKLFCFENKGVSEARNRGLKNANGDYVIFVDADDIINEGYVNDIIKTVNTIPEQFDILGYNYIRGGVPVIPNHVKDGYINYFELYLKYGPPFCSSSVVIAKNKLSDLQLFPEGEWLGEDIYAWAKIIMGGGKVYFRNFNACNYITDINGAMAKQKTKIKLIRKDNEIKIDDPKFDLFINYHKRDYLKSCLIFGDKNSLRQYIKNESSANILFYKILSYLPHALFKFLVCVKRKML
ncbi:TPA: glycosyltransferase family 2 protein [Shigella dysenteriae]|uniref:WfeM n=6 Tax=Enterobacteriaceae TaxID=543 RepID=B5L3S4_SHIDY|nr:MULTISPECIES: glycosyltransferase family 2 protein [Enterobacteriaceae]EDX36410.1 glycosyl transferase, family 2 [Shigella dysenteriae 1012]ACD37008.1 WfeM [Shigella dysenteriae]ACD37016.1 WfeM [Escherichia coli]EFP7227492.1 glycosyltransferase family 2 protein [Shigella dysenteriae]EFP7617450.1 glycosyltransferase family 2 protein [Shigella dysenteriae]